MKKKCGTHLKVGSTPFSGLALVGEVEESALRPIKDKPAFVPRLEPRAHLVQVATGRRRSQRDVRAEFHLVAGCFDVLSQVEPIPADG